MLNVNKDWYSDVADEENDWRFCQEIKWAPLSEIKTTQSETQKKLMISKIKMLLYE